MAITEPDHRRPGDTEPDHRRPGDTEPRRAARVERHEAELSGLDVLQLGDVGHRSRAARLWSATWPKVAALALAIGAWQAVVWSGWKPEFVLASPFTALDRLWQDARTADFWEAVGTTMRRGAVGFGLALVIGSLVGAATARSRVLRAAIGSFITGLQTMPSIAWFPLAILLFGLSESAIRFVVVLGAAPSIANGLIAGVDQVPPLLLRAGRVLGARGLSAWRHVILPAALPNFLGGLKQGWAFAWRSLMAGELLVIIAQSRSIGVELSYNRQFSDSPGLLATMIVILLIGILVDSLCFGTVERAVRRRWGLTESGG
jgi:NitT/TauT family transport system permease protein